MNKYLSILVFIFCFTNHASFGQIGIGTTEPDPSALLDLQSTNQGLLLPRLTGEQREAIINPSAGLMIWCINCGTGTTGELQVFNGAEWTNLIGGEAAAPWVCGNPLIDTRDGKSYATILIGTQCWMKENLNVGSMIAGSSNQANDGTIEKYCYNNLESHCDISGGLYQWDEAMQYSTQDGVRGICPPGWHIPTDAEWTTLTNFVSSIPEYHCDNNSDNISKSLAATTNWNTHSNICAVGNNLAANNATGFTALPGGNRSTVGSFINLGYYGYWWSSKEHSSSYAWLRSLFFDTAYVYRSNYDKTHGRSLRCLRDE